jgi:diamine N-acetyltransferase
MNISIRKADENDYPAILLLLKEFANFQRTPEKVTITVDQMIKEKDLFQCLVAEEETKRIIGFATYFFAYYSWSGKALYLDDLYVSAAFRGDKTGSRLLQEIINKAKSEHCKKVRWQVSKWNTNAIDFYKKAGAIIDETEINCDLFL